MAVSKEVLLATLKKARQTQDRRNDAKFVAQEEGKALLATSEATRLAGMETGAQANVIESVSVNGVTQTITGKGVDITMPTKTSDITNDSDFQTGTEVQNAIAAKMTSTYKAGGSKTAAEITSALLVAANEGKVYNVSEDFTTTADFIEGAGKTHPAGTNVVVVEVTPAAGETPAVYKFDVQAGFVDLSGLVEKEAGKGLSTNDYTTTEKQQLAALEANKNEQISDDEIAAIFVDD